MSPSTRAAASWVLRFLEPGLRPGLLLGNGRPRVAGIRAESGLLDRRIAVDPLSSSFAQERTIIRAHPEWSVPRRADCVLTQSTSGCLPN